MGCTNAKLEQADSAFPKFKIVVVGHEQAGKTSLLRRIIDGLYDGQSPPTLKRAFFFCLLLEFTFFVAIVTSVLWRNQLKPKKEILLEVRSLPKQWSIILTLVSCGTHRTKKHAICPMNTSRTPTLLLSSWMCRRRACRRVWRAGWSRSSVLRVRAVARCRAPGRKTSRRSYG
jgi:hypothetical protein